LAQAAIQSFEMAGGIPAIGNPIARAAPQTTKTPTVSSDMLSVSADDIADPLNLLQDLNSKENQDIKGLLPQSDQIKFQQISADVQADQKIMSDGHKPKLSTWPGLYQLGTTEVNSLNKLIDSKKLSNLVEKKGFKPRPETLAVGQLVKFYPDSHSLMSFYNRLLLEDLFAGHITKTDDVLGKIHLISVVSVPAATPPSSPSFPEKIDISFDPFNSTQLTDASNALNNAGLTLEPEKYFAIPKSSDTYSNWFNATNIFGTSGIFYRPPMPYDITIYDLASNVVTSTVLLPNRSPIFHLELNKAPFVASVSQVTLTNGFISSYTFSKPSSFMALASYPLVLLSDFTSSLTNLIQLRINLATGQNTLQSIIYTNLTTQQAINIMTNSAAGKN
jgi:hypothetical protein